MICPLIVQCPGIQRHWNRILRQVTKDRLKDKDFTHRLTGKDSHLIFPWIMYLVEAIIAIIWGVKQMLQVTYPASTNCL